MQRKRKQLDVQMLWVDFFTFYYLRPALFIDRSYSIDGIDREVSITSAINVVELNSRSNFLPKKNRF